MAITHAAVDVLSAIPVFWALPTASLSGTAAPAGIALIAAWAASQARRSRCVEDSTGGFAVPLRVLGGLLVLRAMLTLLAREEMADVPDPDALAHWRLGPGGCVWVSQRSLPLASHGSFHFT